MAEAVLTNTGELRTLEWYRDPATATPPVPPYEVRLLTALGDDATPGTEVAGAEYVPQDPAWGAPFQDTDGDYAMDNPAVMRYEQLDSAAQTTVVGAEIWDSAATPVRWAHGPLASNVSVSAGAPFEFPPGSCRWKAR